jgi:hypothetical protein
MPFVWQDPEVVLIHCGVKIYRMYRNDDINNALLYHYSFGTGQEDPQFDVRELPARGCDNRKEADHPKIIHMAIDRGDLKVPDEFQPECKHENLLIASYRVNANTDVSLARDADTGEAFDFEFNRIDGEVKEPVFHCEDCGGDFEWEEVKGF